VFETVLETALNEELTEHLGHEKHGEPVSGNGNIRNGTRAKTVLTEASGHVEVEVPRDRAGTFDPQIVKKRQRRLSGVDGVEGVVLSLYAKGLTTGEISAHFAETYGASVSKETISRITDKVVEEMTEWAARPLDEIYAGSRTTPRCCSSTPSPDSCCAPDRTRSSPARRGHLQRRKPVGQRPRPSTEPITVERRTYNTGGISVAKQRVALGWQFRHSVVTMHVSETTLAIELPDGDTKVVHRNTDQAVRNIRTMRPRTSATSIS
jgi:Transposase, Mutator family